LQLIATLRLLEEICSSVFKFHRGGTGIHQSKNKVIQKSEGWIHVKLPSNKSERDEFIREYSEREVPMEDSPFLATK
jgi:hypothetical protein